jgi:hypothetical protein
MKALILIFLSFGTVGALSAPKDKVLENFFKEKTKIENPLELRDPFKAPIGRSEAEVAKSSKGYFMSGKGQFSNIGENNLAVINIQEIKVVGVLIGKERRALVLPTSSAKNIVIIKEGMKIGPDQAELKAILPGGIILVEKIVNVYGQEEYLETVVPISR